MTSNNPIGFPPEVVNSHEIEVIRPDGFLLDLLDLDPVG